MPEAPPPHRCVYYFGLDETARFRFDACFHAKVWHCNGPDEQVCRDWLEFALKRTHPALMPQDLKLLGWDSRRCTPSWYEKRLPTA